MGLYFQQKTLRRDLVYWMPHPSKAGTIAASFISRLIVKVLVDYTGCIQ
jgi:hypothetical protein